MIRVFILLAILAGLVLFTVQNMAPVSLVILGVPTLAFPLAFWVLGAIGAGVLTTIAMAGLIEFTRLRNRPAAQPRRPISDRFSGFRTGGWSAAAPESARSNPRQSNRSEDWDSEGAWEDWDEPAPRSNPPQTPSVSQTPTRDRNDARSDRGYDDAPRRQPPPDAEPIPYRDPPRTDFEAEQEPISRSQSGSVYSYSYRPPAEPPAEKPPVSRSNSIYDAEFRVIMPPHRSEADTPQPQPPPAAPSINSDNSDDEWDFVEDDDSDWDRKR